MALLKTAISDCQHQSNKNRNFRLLALKYSSAIKFLKVTANFYHSTAPDPKAYEGRARLIGPWDEDENIREQRAFYLRSQ